MATQKPKLVVYSDKETFDEITRIAKTQNRSRGNLVETILKEYITSHKSKEGNKYV